MNTIRFLAVVASTILVGCASPEQSAATAGDPETGAGSLPLGGPPPCGYPADYLNMPMTLNDGSGVHVPFAGSVPAGNGVTVPILAPIGASLTSITVRVDPATHTSLNGELLPTLELRKVGQDGIETRVGDLAWDPYAVPFSTWNPGTTVAANYSAPHNIVLPLNDAIVVDAFYFLTISQEWGGGQAQSGVVCGTRLSYSAGGL